jgi:hypothetical protein
MLSKSVPETDRINDGFDIETDCHGATPGLKNEIVYLHRRVIKSDQSVRWFAGEHDIPHPAQGDRFVKTLSTT